MGASRVTPIRKGTPLNTPAAIEQLLRQDKPIWGKLPNEPENLFERFCVYRDLGPDRTRGQVTELLGLKPGSGGISAAMAEYAWVERARAYDRWVAVDRQQRQEGEAINAMVAKWASRAMQSREEQYSLGHAMMTLARNRVGRALGLRFLPDGTTEPIPADKIEPLEALDKDPAKFVRAAAALIEAALYLPARRNDGEVSGIEGFMALPADLTEASDEDMATYLENYDRSNSHTLQ
jgi:hypothetical protein